MLNEYCLRVITFPFLFSRITSFWTKDIKSKTRQRRQQRIFDWSLRNIILFWQGHQYKTTWGLVDTFEIQNISENLFSIIIVFCFCFCFFCNSRTQKRDKESNRTQENSARDTNVTNNQTEHRENIARDTNVTNNQTEHRKTARETLT